MKFLYDYGYYFGSGFVHPLANDGFYDFAELVGIKEENPYKDPKYAINNSIIVGTLIIQESLNCSDFKWMKVVYDSVEEIREYVVKRDVKAFSSLRKLIAYIKQGPDYRLCS